jgi:tetratricopeptide (TPR) repeat protein
MQSNPAATSVDAYPHRLPAVFEVKGMVLASSWCRSKMETGNRHLWCFLCIALFGCLQIAPALALETSKFSGGRNKREAFSKSCEYDQKGIALEEQGKFVEAIAQYKLAIATYPFYAVHYCNLGNALADLKRYSEAVVQYKKAVELAPDSAVAYCNMADALFKQHDYVAAELACMSAIRVDPGYVPAMTNLAEVYLKTNRAHDAITVLNKASGLTTTVGMKKIIANDLEQAKQMLGNEQTDQSVSSIQNRGPEGSMRSGRVQHDKVRAADLSSMN